MMETAKIGSGEDQPEMSEQQLKQQISVLEKENTDLLKTMNFRNHKFEKLEVKYAKLK